MESAPRKGFTIRTATPDDANILIGLFNRAFNKEKDERTSRWKYFDNPHGSSLSFLAEDAGVAGGGYSYVFRRMTYQGEPFLGTQASDAMVDVEFRRRGIFTTLDDEAATHCADLGAPVCMAVAGRQSMHGFLKNGWREIGTYQTYVAVLDPVSLLAGKLPRPLAWGFGQLLGVVLRIIGRRSPLRDDSGLAVRQIDRFDDRFDGLWERVKDRLPIAGVRDAAYLNWRYVDTPTGKHRVLVVEQGDELLGYAVVEDGHGRGYVVDLCAADTAAEDAVLRAALRELKQRGNPMVFLSTLPCQVVDELLRRNGMFPHPKRKAFRNATPYIVRVLRDDLFPAPDVLTDPGQWYVFDGDRDVEHMSPA